MFAPTIGTCDNCDKPNLQLFKTEYSSGNSSLLCRKCYDMEQAAIKDRMQVIATSRMIDSQVQSKSDLFNAGTISFVDIQAAIDGNPEIPTDNKHYAMMEEIEARIKHFTSIFSEAKKTADEAKIAIQELTKKAQEVTPTLDARGRERFKQWDINYTPVKPSRPPKPIKPAKPRFNIKELSRVASQYGVPTHILEMHLSGSNMKPETAAKALVKKIAEKYGVPESLVLAGVKPDMTAEQAARQLAQMMGLKVN